MHSKPCARGGAWTGPLVTPEQRGVPQTGCNAGWWADCAHAPGPAAPGGPGCLSGRRFRGAAGVMQPKPRCNPVAPNATCRYSTLFTAHSPDLGCDVVVKVYENPGASARKQKMCWREATMLQLLTCEGCAPAGEGAVTAAHPRAGSLRGPHAAGTPRPLRTPDLRASQAARQGAAPSAARSWVRAPTACLSCAAPPLQRAPRHPPAQRLPELRALRAGHGALRAGERPTAAHARACLAVRAPPPSGRGPLAPPWARAKPQGTVPGYSRVPAPDPASLLHGFSHA